MLEKMIDPDVIKGLGVSFIVGAFAIYFIAGLIKGTLGIGFPTTAVSLLAQGTDARTAISLVIIPMMVTNLWQVWRNRQIEWVLTNFWRVLVLMVVFIAIFSQVSSIVPIAFITAFLGFAISIYAATTLFAPVFTLKKEHDGPAQYVAGIMAGIMGGLAGMWAAPILIYLSARGITKEQFVATTGLILLVGSSILFVGYWNAGMIGSTIALISCFLLVPSMAGMLMGEHLRKRLSARRFQRVLLWFFLLMGLNLIRRAFL